MAAHRGVGLLLLSVMTVWENASAFTTPPMLQVTRRVGLQIATAQAKGFGKPPPPKAKAAPKKSGVGKAGEVHPALLALIAEAPQRRAAREAMFAARAPELKQALETETYTVIDGLLGETMCSAMRAEAMALLGDKSLKDDIIETDTRAASVIIEPELFMEAPLCTEYVLDCAKTLAPLLSGKFGPLSTDAAANMLACYGVDGGNFPVHIDNHGGGDRRVLTLIYYMNPNYDANRQVPACCVNLISDVLAASNALSGHAIPGSALEVCLLSLLEPGARLYTHTHPHPHPPTHLHPPTHTHTYTHPPTGWLLRAMETHGQGAPKRRAASHAVCRWDSVVRKHSDAKHEQEALARACSLPHACKLTATSCADQLSPLEPIEPVADRLVAFWTCELPHSVEDFRAQHGKVDGRYVSGLKDA